MGYLWLKALHVAAVLTWSGGLMMLCVASLASRQTIDAEFPPNEAHIARTALHWDRWITVPAMLLLWASGLALARQGHWMGARWLSAKLVMVVLLSCVHGVLAASLRKRLEHGAPARRRRASILAALSLCGLVTVALLVVLKP